MVSLFFHFIESGSLRSYLNVNGAILAVPITAKQANDLAVCQVSMKITHERDVRMDFDAEGLVSGRVHGREEKRLVRDGVLSGRLVFHLQQSIGATLGTAR